MATNSILIDEGGRVVRLNPAAVSLQPYAVTCGKSAKTPLQLLVSIARECKEETMAGRIEDDRILVTPASGDCVFRLWADAFGLDKATAKKHDGAQFYFRLSEVLAEVAIRKDADKIVEACNKKRKAYQTTTSGIPLSDAQLMRRANNLVPNWRELKAEQRLAPIVDALRRLQFASTPATVTKAATPVPPTTPAKVAPMPTRKPQPALTPATPAPTGQGELSPHARALVDALAKIGGPAIKATMLQTAGIPASAWSDALSEAYRARKITRDRARTDNVWHVLAK